MNEAAVLAEVETNYGTLEDFVLHLLTEVPEVLDEEWNLDRKAHATGLSRSALSFLLNRSTQFRSLIRSDLVNQEFTLAAERKHIHQVVKIAENSPISRLTATGDTVEVDQAPADIMKAGEYLNKYRNTPIADGQKQTMMGFQIHFGGNEGEVRVEQDGKTLEISAEKPEQALPGATHRPSRAGELPPPGAIGRYDGARSNAEAPLAGFDGGDIDFYSREAEEKARDQEIAAKRERKEASDPFLTPE